MNQYYIFAPETIKTFQNLTHQIKQKIAQTGIETLQKTLARYPHLIHLLTEIQDNNNVLASEIVTKLDNYLGSYLQNIQQAQKERELSLEQRTKLNKVLYHLLPKTTNYITKTNKYIQIVEQLI